MNRTEPVVVRITGGALSQAQVVDIAHTIPVLVMLLGDVLRGAIVQLIRHTVRVTAQIRDGSRRYR
jgi:hypothetical protein